MTLTSLLADCYRRLGFGTTVDSATSVRITAFINETQQEILSEPGMESLLFDSHTFSSAASTPEYSMTSAIGRIRRIYDTTNLLTLQPQSQEWYRTAYPSPTALTGIAYSWVDLGFVAYRTALSNASELFVDSTSASDTNTAYVEGIRSSLGPTTLANTTMTGTTGKSISTTITDWTEVTKFYLSAAAVGTVTLLEDAEGGTELARIGIGQTMARYRRIALAVCPSSVINYTVEFERDVTDLVNGTDEPVMPPRFHRLLATGARMKEYEKMNDQNRYQTAKAEYQRGLGELKYFIYSQAVGQPNLRGHGHGRLSRLGPYYPADRW